MAILYDIVMKEPAYDQIERPKRKMAMVNEPSSATGSFVVAQPEKFAFQITDAYWMSQVNDSSTQIVAFARWLTLQRIEQKQ